MTLNEIYNQLFNELKLIYEVRESRNIAMLLLEDIGYNNIKISTNPSVKMNQEEISSLRERMKEIMKHNPVQYVLGKADFYGLSFKVNGAVMIPRQETEELVEMIIKNHGNDQPKIMDIGTGSGCIAISLAKHINDSVVYAIDFSRDALDVAMENARNHKVNVNFLCDDLLKPLISWSEESFDIVVSNPPYVLEEDRKKMKPNVLNYEPHCALFADRSDPLLFYRKIFRKAEKILKPGAYLYCEINEKLGREIQKLAMSHFFEKVEIIMDINEKDRFVRAIKKDGGNPRIHS